MKKLIASIAALVLIKLVAAQDPYVLTVSTGMYHDLASPNVISVSPWDNNLSVTIPMPFPFTMNGIPRDSITMDVSDDCFIRFNSTDGVVFLGDLVQENAYTRTAWQVSGSAPNRVLKVEYHKMGLGASAPGDFINFQVWFHEGSNSIEWHFGESSWHAYSFDSGKPKIMLVTSGSVCKIARTGVGSAPYLYYLLSGGSHYGIPPVNTIYTISYPGIPVASFKRTQPGGSVCRYDEVGYEAETVQHPIAYNWTFPGGSPGTYSGMQPPTITYASDGSFDVILETSNDTGFFRRTIEDFIVIDDCGPTGLPEIIRIAEAKYSVDNTAPGELSVFDMLGRKITGFRSGGYSEFDLSQIQKGIYLVTYVSAGNVRSWKIVR